MIRTPSKAELRDIARDLHFELSEAELADYERLVRITLNDYETIQELSEPTLPPHEFSYADREPGTRPPRDENPHNAWITRTRVESEADGPLADKRVGLKDTISLAGVEMTCGSHLMEGYVPDVDATVVRRVLDAGGTVLGKCNMDAFGLAASGDISAFGPVTNPRDDDYLAGGSSSGCAAALAADEIDVALGCDQGGSIRIPAAWCGVVGLDPTTGLVPYTGIFPLDNSIDHVGPMARTVEEVATTLDVIAGIDGLDPRQPAALETDEYTAALGGGLDDTTVAVLEDGFEHAESDDRVNAEVRDAVDTLDELGAETTRARVPLHRKAPPMALLVWGYGGLQIFKQGGQGSLYDGWYNTGLMRIFSKSRRAASDELTSIAKATMLAMEFLDRQQQNTLYGKAQNVSFELRQRYDEVLADADVLAMPTVPSGPIRHDPDLDRVERVLRSFPPTKNVCPFVLTNHPSITVPCGTVDGVPVGLLLVAESFDEATLLRVAHAFEQRADVSLD
ncbi:MAG: amidase [Haloarculaceae archaeon]